AALRLAGALNGQPGFTGSATTSINASPTSYVITPTQGTLNATNYIFPAAQMINGTLTINRRIPVVTWATPAAISYPTPLSATQLNAVAKIPGSSSSTGMQTSEALDVAPLMFSALLAPSEPSAPAPPPDFTQITDCVTNFDAPGIGTGFCTPVWKLPFGTPEIAFDDHGTVAYDA